MFLVALSMSNSRTQRSCEWSVRCVMFCRECCKGWVSKYIFYHVNSKDVPFSQQTPDKSLLNFKIHGMCFCITWEFLKVKHCASQKDFVLWSEEAEYKLCRLHPSAAWWMTWCLSKSQVIAPQRTHLKYLNVVEHEQLGHRVSKQPSLKACVDERFCHCDIHPPLTKLRKRNFQKICPNTSADCKWDEKAERVRSAMFSQIRLDLLSNHKSSDRIF